MPKRCPSLFSNSFYSSKSSYQGVKKEQAVIETIIRPLQFYSFENLKIQTITLALLLILPEPLLYMCFVRVSNALYVAKFNDEFLVFILIFSNIWHMSHSILSETLSLLGFRIPHSLCPPLPAPHQLFNLSSFLTF